MLPAVPGARNTGMPHYSYERLCAQDHLFLLAEGPTMPMHVSSVQIYELGPLATAEGGVDYASIKRAVASALHRVPRYRQKLQWIPIENRAVWIDDWHFNLDYHVRHTALPRPGSREQLQRLCGRIMSQLLDRERPLWEMWIVEGIENGRFAIVSKTHHCMVDDATAIELHQILQSPEKEFASMEPPPYIPRRPPSRTELVRDALGRIASLPIEALRGLGEIHRHSSDLRAEILVRARALEDFIGMHLHACSDSPLHGALGPHRSFDWTTMSLADLRKLHKTLRCTFNDVVLTIATSAFREFLIHRHVRPEDLDFRVQAPVSVHEDGERGKSGPRVAEWIVPLPVGERDPLRQLEAIREVTADFAGSRSVLGVGVMMTIAEWTPSLLLSLAARSSSRAASSIVANVPGPQYPLYLLGAELLEMFPQVPLLRGSGLSVALVSYSGKACWGVHSDAALVPDLADFVSMLDRSLVRLARVAGVDLGGSPGSSGTSELETPGARRGNHRRAAAADRIHGAE